METKLKWKKGLFSDTYNIFDNNKQIGFIKKNYFSQKSIAEINGETYEFQERGFFNQETDIVDISKNRVVGKIKYSTWGNKAYIEVNNEISTWEYKNVWNTKWIVSDSKGLNILYDGSFSNGRIETNGDDTIKLLSGLYAHNYYMRIALVVLICCLSCFISVFVTLH